MTNINDLLHQSFLEEQNRLNNRKINNTEQININNLFTTVIGFNNECNICYDDKKCIKCFQCEFKYCNECLVIISSEFTKCSSCQVNFKNNYGKLINYNLTFINDLKKQNQNQNNLSNRSNISSEYNNYYNDNYAISLALEELNLLDHSDYNTNTKNNQKNNQQNNQQNNNLDYIYSELGSNRNIEYIPNYQVYYDDNYKTLIYFAQSNINLPQIYINNNILEISFNYKLKKFLIHILDYPEKFNFRWTYIAQILENYSRNYSRNHNTKNKNHNIDHNIDYNKNSNYKNVINITIKDEDELIYKISQITYNT